MKMAAIVLAMGIFFGTPMRTEAAIMPEESAQIALTYGCETYRGEEHVRLHYLVTREGETMDSISLRFGLGEDYLHSVNPEYEKGENIALKSSIALPEQIYWPDVAKGVYYYISAGDTLTEIAQYFDATVKELMELNPQINNPDYIYKGDIIRVI